MSGQGRPDMSRDADRKRALLTSWWANLLPAHSCRLFEPLELLDPKDDAETTVLRARWQNGAIYHLKQVRSISAFGGMYLGAA
jgi:hypothetical protein